MAGKTRRLVASGFQYPGSEAFVQFAAPMRVEFDTVPTLASAGLWVNAKRPFAAGGDFHDETSRTSIAPFPMQRTVIELG